MHRIALLGCTLALLACTEPASQGTPPAAASRNAPGAQTDEARPQAPAAVTAIVVANPWIRAMAPNAPAAGGFLTLRNEGAAPDRLLAVRTGDAARVEIHEMREENGVMRMRELTDGLALPAGATVTLAPGGQHLMFMEPARRFAEGETVNVELQFERGGTRTVQFAVKPLTATGEAHARH